MPPFCNCQRQHPSWIIPIIPLPISVSLASFHMSSRIWTTILYFFALWMRIFKRCYSPSAPPRHLDQTGSMPPFIKKSWPALRGEVRRYICSFFQHNTLDTKLNCTNHCPYLEIGGGNNTA